MSWYKFIKQGLSRNLPADRICGPGKNRNFKDDLTHIYPYLKRYRRRAMIGVGIILVAALLAFPSPLIIRYLIDEVILRGQIELLFAAIVFLIGILGAEKLARFSEEFYFARFERRIILDIHSDLVARILRLPKSFFDDHQTGYLMARISDDVDRLRWLFSRSVVYMISNSLRFMGGIGFLFFLEWKLSIVVLFLLPALALSMRYFSAKIHVLSHHSMEQNAKAAMHFQESLSEAALIKTFASEDRTHKRLISALKNVFQISLEQVTVNSLANLVINFIPGISRATVFAVGAFWVIKGQWTLGSLLAYQAYLAYVFGPAQFLASANLQLQEARSALERVCALFDIVPEENMGSGKKIQRLNGEIELRNVSFTYNGATEVLKDICLHIQAGERIAIVGPSGVGKTTLMSLMLRLYRPTAGEIYFDGLPASEYEVSALRRRIGYVSQQPRLLTGSIAENLRYGNPNAPWDQIIRSARACGIHDAIVRLPDGYHTEIGENGIKLSEGQKQRLTIARALIKDPDILILDEPGAALNSRAEMSLFDALPEMLKQKTIVVVTHRPSTMRHADRILLLNESQLIDIGTQRSQLDSDDDYRAMIDYQRPGIEEGNRSGVQGSDFKVQGSGFRVQG